MGGRVNAPDAKDMPGAVYAGAVVHRRARPKRHALRYEVFSLLVDLDRLDELDRRLRLFSVGRFNLFSLMRQDFGPHDGSDLAAFVRARARRAGLREEVARIRMLAYPRILGYAFNPITVYFLDNAAGETVMLLYEVSNTFGEHHFYHGLATDPEAPEIRHEAAKALYVSPFNTLEGRYRFAVRPPGERVFVGVTLTTGEGGLLTAYFNAARRPLTDGTLFGLALAYPFMTAKVTAGIHWEALLLWLKGVRPTLRLRRERRARRPAPR